MSLICFPSKDVQAEQGLFRAHTRSRGVCLCLQLYKNKIIKQRVSFAHLSARNRWRRTFFNLCARLTRAQQTVGTRPVPPRTLLFHFPVPSVPDQPRLWLPAPLPLASGCQPQYQNMSRGQVTRTGSLAPSHFHCFLVF